MALLKYIGPFDEVRVSVAGQEIGIVANGESLAVPDELAGQSEWQEEHWELMKDKPNPKAETTASSSGTNTK